MHAIDCPRLAEFEDRDDLWRDLQWTPEAEDGTVSQARLTATIRDAPGVLGQACTIIGEAGGNIIGLRMDHRGQGDFFDVDFDVEVSRRAPPDPHRRRPARLPAGGNGGAGEG